MGNETNTLPRVVVVMPTGGEERRREVAVFLAAELLKKLGEEEKSLQNRLQSPKNCDTISI